MNMFNNCLNHLKCALVAILFVSFSQTAFADDADNIGACVTKAKDLTGVLLDPFASSYEGNIFSMSTAKWSNAYCEVKLAEVYTLNINGREVVYKSYTGKESYELNQKLQTKTEDAIHQLEARIALLRQRANQVSESLKQANPDYKYLNQFIDEGIKKAISK